MFSLLKCVSILDTRVPVVQVTGGSVASSRLQPGDVITSIGDAETAPLTHTQAMQAIKDCGNALQLRITRYASWQ